MWVRLDDGFADHRKVLDLSDAAFRLHVCAMCWAGRRGTDGLIVRRDLRVLLAMLPDDHDGPALAAQLVRSGAWEPDEQGWRIHNFLRYNPPAAEVAREQEAAKERMRKLRARSPERSGEQTGERSDVRSGEVRSPRPDPIRSDPERPDPIPESDPPKSPPRGAAPEAQASPMLPGMSVPPPAAPPYEEPSGNGKDHCDPSRKRTRTERANAEYESIALGLLTELTHARRRVDKTCRVLDPTPGNLKHFIDRLRDGYTVEQIRHVIGVVEARSRVDPHTLAYFDAKSPFRRDNIGRWEAMTLEQARKAPPSGFSRAPPTQMIGKEETIQSAREADELAADPEYQKWLIEEMKRDD